MNGSIPSFLLSPGQPAAQKGRARFSRSVLNKSIGRLAILIRTTLMQWDLSSRAGLLQRTDPRVKLLGLLFLLVVASLKKAVLPELCLVGLLCMLVLLSRLGLFGFYRRVCLLAFLFGFLVVAPAALNLFTPGTIVMPLISFGKSSTFWIYTVPESIGITREGLVFVSLLTLRVFNSLSICFLLLYTTPLTELIRALKVLHVPDTLLMVFVLTYKYILIFSRTLEEVYQARKSRIVCATGTRRTGDWAAGRMAFFFRKTQLKCEEVFYAMVARGAGRQIRIQETTPMKARDFSIGLCLVAAGMVLLWM